MSNQTNTFTAKGNNLTPKGTMPKDMLEKHKLPADTRGVEVVLERKILEGHHHTKVMKRLVQMVSHYRLTVHGVRRRHVAKPLVMGVRYFTDPFKPEFRNRDRAPVEVTVAETAAQA